MTKLLKKRIIVKTITIIAFLIFLVVLFQAVIFSPGGEIPLPKGTAREALTQINKEEYPARITIPSLKIDTKVEDVGITKKGNMATPSNFADVGWYRYGALPGTNGTALIAGHVDNGLALPAVFANLDNLKKGDDIFIENAQRKRVHFVVTQKTTYSFDASTEDIFKSDGTKSIKLITCAGTWLSKYDTHDKRLVVSAILKE